MSTSLDNNNTESYKRIDSIKVYESLSGNTKVEGTSSWRTPGTKKITSEKIGLSVFDVASYILQKEGEMTTMKLQKLVYYCQAWSLVWDEMPLFKESIEAWANGPVVRELFSFHRGSYLISSIPMGNADLLTGSQKETVDSVLKFYGPKTTQWLIELTHLEDPWRNARKGTSPLDRSNVIITLDSMAEYYSSL